MQIVTTIFVDGLIDASWIFIVAVGLTLTLGVLRILNLAHGSFYAIGAYAAATTVGWYYGHNAFPPLIGLAAMLAAAALITLACGPILERLIFRQLHQREEGAILLITYALSLILDDGTKLLWGTDPYYAFQPYSLFGNVWIGELPYVGYDLFLIALAIVVGFALWFGLNRTRSGKMVLAVIYDREMSLSQGINVRRIFFIMFVIGFFLAALAGAFTAPKISVQPGLSVMVILYSFAVVIIGGFGSIEGAAIASILVGIARAVAIHIVPWAEVFIIYLVLAFVLAVRPQGIFAPMTLRKI